MAYQSKATISTIKATSRVAIKINDNFYTVEYTEERNIPDVEGVDVDEERKILWDDVNATVDTQAEDIIKTFKKKS